LNVHRLRPIAGLVVLATVILGSLGYLWWVSQGDQGPLQASGTVEGVEVRIGPEVSGRVVEVLVEEGQRVEAGQPLFRQDDKLLTIQRDLVAATGTASVAAARMQLLTAELALKQLFEDAPVRAGEAELAVANARDALDDAERRRSYQQQGRRATDETIEGVEAQLELAKDAVSKAQQALNRVEDLSSTDPKRAAAEAALYEARKQRDALQTNLNWYKGKPTDIDQALLEAAVHDAQAKLARAQTEWDKWKDGPDPEQLALRQADIEQARAQLALAQARAAADTASMELQLEKVTTYASVAGAIIARGIEPGEVLMAGAPALSILQDDVLTITVFLPEDRYGAVQVGDRAEVEIDTFPGTAFEAVVTRIADKAEFTPRNVQTEEGRRNTVFAVQLSVMDPEGRLKPGMPADVRFGP
jgi:HlyD family secretion protein